MGEILNVYFSRWFESNDYHKAKRRSLAEYTQWFKTAKDLLESHIGGALILTKSKRCQSTLTTTWQFSKIAARRPMRLCLISCIWWTLIKESMYRSCNLVQQKSLGNDRYPKTIAEANHVLSNNCVDVSRSKRIRKEINKKQTRIKSAMNLQNLLFLKWWEMLLLRKRMAWISPMSS